jgi:hypothetical protein
VGDLCDEGGAFLVERRMEGSGFADCKLWLAIGMGREGTRVRRTQLDLYILKL